MLLPDNISPEHSIYYNGAIVLQAIREHRVTDMLELYLSVQMKREMSLPVFVLCLDWLFLIDQVAMDDQGKVVLCS